MRLLACKFATILCLSLLLGACESNLFNSGDDEIQCDGTGCGNGNSATDIVCDGTGCGNGVRPDTSESVKGKALLGPVVNATVHLYDVTDLETIVCSTVTSDSKDLEKAGLIQFEPACVDESSIYVVEVNGGLDIDFDDDGVLDEEPHPVLGRVRALITGQRILLKSWYVTALTEQIYVSMQYFLNFSTPAELIAMLDSIAPYFLKDDINDDGAIDVDDLLEWNPTKHLDALYSSADITKTNRLIHTARRETKTHEEILALEMSKEFRGHIDTVQAAQKVTVVDTLAFVAAGSTLLILDISDPGAPKTLSKLATGRIFDFAISGRYLYIVQGNAGILKVDVVNPQAPVIVAETDWARTRIDVLQSAAQPTVWISGQVAWSGEQDVRYLDSVQGPFLSPLSLSPEPNRHTQPRTTQPSLPTMFKIIGNLAFIGSQSTLHSSVHIVDLNAVQDLPAPQVPGPALSSGILSQIDFLPGEFPILYPLMDVEVIGDTAYFAAIDFSGGALSNATLAFDISDPARPQRLDIPAIAARGFNACGDGGLCVWEGSQLSLYDESLQRVASTTVPDFSRDSLLPVWVALGEFGMVLAEIEEARNCENDPVCLLDSLELLNLSLNLKDQPLNVRVHAALAALQTAYSYGMRLDVDETHAYFAADEYGLLIFELPAKPMATTDTPLP